MLAIDLEEEKSKGELFGLSDLHDLRNKSFGYGNNREASITVEEDKNGVNCKVRKTVQLGISDKVPHEVSWPSFESESGFRRRIIHFHSHPDVISDPDLVSQFKISSDTYPKSGSAAEMLPSIAPNYFQYQTFSGGGDLALSYATNIESDDPQPFERSANGSIQGGSVNLITKDGVTLLVGLKPLERDMKVVSKMRERIGTNLDDEFKPTWRILHGTNNEQLGNNLSSFTDKIEASKQGLDLLADNGVGVMRLDYFSAQTSLYFVTLSWDVVDQVVEESGGMHKVAFGNGLIRLAEILKTKYGVLDLPVEASLTDVLNKVVFPIRREGKSIQTQSDILELLSKRSWQPEDWNTVREILSSLNEVTEIKNGIELRALLFEMSGHLPWPDMIKESLEGLMANEKTGTELIFTLTNRKRLETQVAQNTDYENKLPGFYFDILAEQAILLYKRNPETVGKSKYGRPEFKDDYLKMLILTLNSSGNRLDEYRQRWLNSDLEEREFAGWINEYFDAFNEPL